MSQVFFPATKHSSLGNVFLVCLLAENNGTPEDETLGAHQYFENLRSQGKWGEDVDGLVLAWENKSVLDEAREAAVFASSPKDPSIPGKPADPYLAVHMKLFNSDGSEAETSGNGICCLGQVLANSYPEIKHFLVEAASRWEDVKIQGDEAGSSVLISTTMGVPSLAAAGSEQERKANEAGAGMGSDNAMFVSVGNPHVVMMMDDVSSVNPSEDGPRVIAEFGEEVNVEFASYDSETEELEMKVWERGAGATQACGSGAVACVAALSHLKGGKIKAVQAEAGPQIYEDIAVNMPGGSAVVRRYFRPFLPMLYMAEAESLGDYEPV